MEVKPADPDAQLLLKMQTGEIDEANWRDFRKRIQQWICYRYPSLRATADDLAGEAALCVFVSVHSFRGEARFIRWVHCITRRIVSKHHDKQARVVVMSVEDLPEEVVANDKIEKRLLHLAAKAAMQTLTEQEHRVFLLRVTNDMDHKEIARRIGISDNASRQTWMRAMAKIRRYRLENQW